MHIGNYKRIRTNGNRHNTQGLLYLGTYVSIKVFNVNNYAHYAFNMYVYISYRKKITCL